MALAVADFEDSARRFSRSQTSSSATSGLSATDRSRDYRSYYDDALAEQVGKYFRRDIELLNYRFDPSAS